ncbi:NUDIX hydrolase [Rhodococcus sp. IEGM 1401]|uniref:NrtR DNA-binding winged helix domain-containing protein n=1 Tax=unclassified Rhodococcus (in: high G+C Gram-positive bacteria) TaxID=192944 RepID=UPI000B9BBD6A|nr:MULTISPECIES: NUDIX hydrolase [unclassified Rhodococcus (in: high G+C Gram-positive bacteria)]MCZ4562140.1 NUDIX hydrolase [Rhodococcus sp. IEGM 1401]MDI9922144.1 NUDIX hydrolase [Rhodococcus sp. IEGM 1372]MDV8034696.1 NUDIX hydrolase [Rhodococcus sp. IEGM 1414]OZF45477.1 NUDIX hydrolase [Rhodococcus sp. 14-1411-2a]
MTWRDRDGNALTDYPRPSVAVDVAVLTVREQQLHVVVVPSERGPALPGTFLRPSETLADAADRALRTKADLIDLTFHQLRMFDDPDRDDRGWVLSMAHGAAISARSLAPTTESMPIDDSAPVSTLAFDHGTMVTEAVLDLRDRYAREVDPALLTDAEFTLLELREVYEIVFDRALPKDTFRRHVIGSLEGTGTTSTAGGGRPAELYRRASNPALPASAGSFLLR